jgi:hypothetical protein
VKGLAGRLERLEKRMGAKQGPRLIYLMPNLEEEEDEQETPYCAKISSDVWAHVFGSGRLTMEEIHRLKEEYSK